MREIRVLSCGHEIGDVFDTIAEDAGKRDNVNSWLADDAFAPFMSNEPQAAFSWAKKRNDMRRQREAPEAGSLTRTDHWFHWVLLVVSPIVIDTANDTIAIRKFGILVSARSPCIPVVGICLQHLSALSFSEGGDEFRSEGRNAIRSDKAVHGDEPNEHGLTNEEYLCIGCIEARLGCLLTAADFTSQRINEHSEFDTAGAYLSQGQVSR